MDLHKQQQDNECDFCARRQAEKAPASSSKTQSDFIREFLQQQAGFFTGPMSSTLFSGTPTFGSDFSFHQPSNFNSPDLPGDLAGPSTDEKGSGWEPWSNSGREGSVTGSSQSSKHSQDGGGLDDSGDDGDDDSEGGNSGGGGGDDPPPPNDNGRDNRNGSGNNAPELTFCAMT
uniref:Uncharacterized protein n=1 Tax=Moniliophthora roreri TaxID=221103 RepID=A0A0W0FK46_MONRR